MKQGNEFVKASKGGLIRNVRVLGKRNVVSRKIVRGKSILRSPFNINRKRR